MTDFTSFGGQISSDGKYVFPTLYSRDRSGRVRTWEIAVELVNYNKMTPIPILPQYLQDAPLPSIAVAQYQSKSGLVGGVIQKNKATAVNPTNVGRANERNTLKSALVKARALYLKEMDKGKVPNAPPPATPTAKATRASSSSSSSTVPAMCAQPGKRIYPMLARTYDDERDTMTFPQLVQPKLDGMRALVHLDMTTPANPKVVIYSRLLKDIEGFEALREELKPHLLAFYRDESLYLDGEFYEHGKNLQYITGVVRNVARNRAAGMDVKLHVFDAFYPSSMTTPYELRLAMLKQFLASKPNARWEHVVEVPTISVASAAEGDAVYTRFLAQKYEGAMYKSPDAPYLGSATATSMALRSRDVLKRKASYREEFEVVGFTQGTRGKDIGAIIWVCKTADGHEFRATPKNMTYDERAKLFKQAMSSFKKQFEGRMMSIEFQDLSKDGIPLRAKALGFRDYE